MNPNNDNQRSSLPLSAAERIDEVCMHFERAWRQDGNRPRLEEFLVGEAGPEQEELLGVTARPLHCKCEESLPSDEVAVRIETLGFAFNAILLERLPVTADPHTA